LACLLQAATSKDKTALQNTCLSAKLRRYAHELPFSVANAGQPTSSSIEALYTSIGGSPCTHFLLIDVKI